MGTRLALAHLSKLTHAVICAIIELHSINLAHLDVRLENICFNDANDMGSAILIDLDRSKPAQDNYEGDTTYKSSCMYTVPEELQTSIVTNSTMDWVQLGFMLIWILLKDVPESKDVTEYHGMKSALISKLNVNRNCKTFLQNLALRGKY